MFGWPDFRVGTYTERPRMEIHFVTHTHTHIHSLSRDRRPSEKCVVKGKKAR